LSSLGCGGESSLSPTTLSPNRPISALSQGSTSGSLTSPRTTTVSPVVTYNDLCFPKTSNYGSMRKMGRWDIGKLNQRL